MKKIKLEVSKLVASCLQRMIADEIENQKKWLEEDNEFGIKHRYYTREEIIKQMNELADDIEKQGIRKHYM